MRTGASPSPTPDARRRTGALALVLAVAGLVALSSAAVAQRRGDGERLDYLNERLRIPESDRFSEGAYIESGVGLTFGVDRRLSYYPGNYEEAAGQFEEAVRRYRYKADIWVFLSRAYFYMKAPERARQALVRAGQLMPDLEDRLWGPLVRGLEWEIRVRANSQQVQADFYTSDQGEFLSLFRLYRFLADTAGAAEVVRAADQHAVQMVARARMVSAESRKAYARQAQSWLTLADSLRLELAGMGGYPPDPPEQQSEEGEPVAEQDVEESERLRVLQLKIDYYRAEPDEYRELFKGYLAGGRTTAAAAVLDAVDREIRRLRIQASVAPNVQVEAEIEDDSEALQAMRQEFRQTLDAGIAAGAGP